jgi:hypothetical protein
MWDDESMDARTVGFVKSSLIVRNGHPKTPFLAVSALWPLRQEKGGPGRFLKKRAFNGKLSSRTPCTLISLS